MASVRAVETANIEIFSKLALFINLSKIIAARVREKSVPIYRVAESIIRDIR